MRTLTIAVLCSSCIAMTAFSARAAEAFGLLEVDRIGLFHAEGAQIYECRPEPDGSLRWHFKEPVAALFEEGKPVGVHLRGPSWEFSDGTAIAARVIAQAPAASTSDIPHLALAVTSARGTSLALARAVVRFNTRGGRAPDSCSEPGNLLSVSYSADYAFYISEVSPP